MNEEYPPEILVKWLENQYRLHHEIEDKLAAELIERLVWELNVNEPMVTPDTGCGTPGDISTLPQRLRADAYQWSFVDHWRVGSGMKKTIELEKEAADYIERLEQQK